ncbi:DNA-processing protein DprA [Nitrospirillum bahiense]|uniref:DNA processing protein n=1 Tax=Nitrospirillum amazonense TaxID=28077 RepID=A0A560FMX3_9PROT|nr:DNA-processing protein DprA [Nitrospirillum amazonense]TWB22920.1 DNA processing protein [Nitrospirillum amazonense]
MRGTRALSPVERLDWLRLTRTESVGPVTFHRLMERFGTPAAALEALPDLARRGGRDRPLSIAPRAAAERELAALDRMGARLLCWCEPDYPAQLAAIEDAPPVITVLGDPARLSRPAVAVVGARNASLTGRKLAAMISRDLAEAGITVVSGLARGIDTAAHEAALHRCTIAALAGGVDVIYPPENAELHRRIADQGALVAESPPGTEPQARHFPRRNRLISGLSRGVLVVEAALKSGSLITARLALEQGRDLFAVPGSPLDPRAQGCNRLLKDGAVLVETADDILAYLGPQGLATFNAPPAGGGPVPPPADPGEKEVEAARPRVTLCLSPTPVHIDEIVRDCQLSAAVVLTILLEMELAGRLHRHPGGRVSLA